MAKKKARHSAAPLVEPAAPPVQGFWEARALPLLTRRPRTAALCLVLLAVMRIMATYPETGPTWDEPGHMACGLQYLAQHVYRYEAQHPPLARVMSASGPFLAGARPLGTQNQDEEGVAVMYRRGHPERILTLMRLGILPFFLLASLVVYWWARRHFDNAIAVVATGLFTLIPPVLAHAGLATTDMPLAACLGAAYFALLLWAEQPTWKHSLLFGAATGLAVVSKFTALGFFPAAAFFALLAFVAVKRPGMNAMVHLARERAPTFALAVFTGALLIWAIYSFSFGSVAGWSVRLPAPEFFDGVRFALHHNDQGHPAYLLGEIRNTGWWYYFPVVLGVKTPIAFLLLMAYAAGLWWRNRRKLVYWLPWSFAAGILIPSMTSHVNIGVRHILPVFLAFSISAAAALVRLAERAKPAKWRGPVAAGLVLWMAASGAFSHPGYLAYFNELASRHPEQVLVDSDLDWGQDTIRLARRLRELGARSVSFNTLNLTPDRLAAWPGFPPVRGINPLQPAEGWTAVSPTIWMIHQYGLEHRYPNLQPWFAYLPPTGKVGALSLYYVPPGSIPQTPPQ